MSFIMDSHMHSLFSFDSDMKVEDACRVAKEKGLSGITFTEHLDVRFPDEDYVEPNWERYIATVKQAATNQSTEFKVMCGVEIGYQQDTVEETQHIISSLPFDFIINSVHVLEGLDLYESYYEGRDQKDVYVKYLQEVVASIRNTPDFDVVGHIGYLRRYSPYPDYSLAYAHHDYTDLIDEALRMLVDQGKGIDVNTSGYRTVMGRKIGSPIPGYDIIKRYVDLGGEILVLGSDAHNTQTIADGFDQACDSLRSIGIHYLTYYQKRMPVQYKI